MNAGKLLRDTLAKEKPLQIVGVMNAYVALMAEKVGFQSLYLSGANVANSVFGLPDIGWTSLDNVLDEARKITERVSLPLIVDIDTGWSSPARTVQLLHKAGVAGVHIEDQTADKRCGHLKGKKLVSTEEMVERLRDCHPPADFFLIARTDAMSVEGLEKTIERCKAYQKAGAHAIFLEAPSTLADYTTVRKAVDLPILANMTEFGVTPLYTKEELQSAKVDMILYPLSANRAMNLAGLEVLYDIKNFGDQKRMLDRMQTREELYEFLNYSYGEKYGRPQG